MKKYFVSGIDTNCGKTIIASILVEALCADYWKPIQSGELDTSDTKKVKSLISNTTSVFHDESYKLTSPLSPHASAAIDGIEVLREKIQCPQTENSLIIEGAGGLLVPLSSNFLIIDLIEDLDAELILVSKNYLGSINHTLLSVEAIIKRNLRIAGIIFNGPSTPSTEEIIQERTQIPCLGRVPELERIDKDSIKKAGKHISL